MAGSRLTAPLGAVDAVSVINLRCLHGSCCVLCIILFYKYLLPVVLAVSATSPCRNGFERTVSRLSPETERDVPPPRKYEIGVARGAASVL